MQAHFTDRKPHYRSSEAFIRFLGLTRVGWNHVRSNSEWFLRLPIAVQLRPRRWSAPHCPKGVYLSRKCPRT